MVNYKIIFIFFYILLYKSIILNSKYDDSIESSKFHSIGMTCRKNRSRHVRSICINDLFL